MWPDDSDNCDTDACDASINAGTCKGCECDACSSCPYHCAGLAGEQMDGTATWHNPTTENPKLDDVKEWWIYNFLGDAHPMHLHLVHFNVLGRKKLKWDSGADDDGFCDDSCTPLNDGIYIKEQPTVQHMGAIGMGYRAFASADWKDWNNMDLYGDYDNTTNADLNWIYETAR